MTPNSTFLDDVERDLDRHDAGLRGWLAEAVSAGKLTRALCFPG